MPKPVNKSGNRYSLSKSASGNAAETWETVDPSLVMSALIALAKVGTSITFSVTRDGGTVGVMLMDDGVKYPAYAGDTVELETLLESIRLQAELAT